MFSIVAVPIYMPTSSARGSLYPTPLPAFVLTFLMAGITTGMRGNLTVLFISSSLMMLSIFSVPVGHSYTFFRKLFIHVLYPFLTGLFWGFALELISSL